MKYYILVFAFLLIAAPGAPGQVSTPAGFDLSNYGVRIEPDKRLMAVLAAIEMAETTDGSGRPVKVVNTPLSAGGQRFREQLRADLADLPADLRQKITVFMTQHKKRFPDKTDAQLVAPFISMAYSLSPAPELADPLVTGDLPGDLLDVLDFAPLVREFYRRSVLPGKLDEYAKTYLTASDTTLRSSAKVMVSELLGYLHTRPQTFYTERIETKAPKAGSKKEVLKKIELRERQRRFFIVPEMLAPVGDINFVNIRDDYFVVVPPETDLSFSEARRAFLRFVIDPIVLDNAKEVSTMREGITSLLNERRKVNPAISPDIYLAVSRSLVAAADARQTEFLKTSIATDNARRKIAQMKTDAEKRAVSAELERLKQSLADTTAMELSEEYEKGSVLAFYFAEQLKGLEDSGFDIASSMREMVLSFDSAKETGRLEQFSEARKRAIAARSDRKKNPTVPVIAENPVTSKLLEIEKTIQARNLSAAGADLQQLLKSNPDEPRIYYGIGRVASLEAEELTDSELQQKKLLEAKTAYENAIRTAVGPRSDAALTSKAYVALAKIYEFYDNNDYAVRIYDQVIKIGDVSGGAYNEALAAKQRLLKQP